MSDERIVEIYDLLSRNYGTYEDTEADWINQGLSSTPFHSLISVALSTMTTTPRTIKAAVALYEQVKTFEDLAAIDVDELRDLIRSVAHYNRKAVNLKAMAGEILERHGGEVPRTREELMALTGIGRKCTDIMLTYSFDEPAIAVDTHVHRVTNRLAMVETSNPVQTADRLAEVTPSRYVRHAHEWLLQHGMQTCKARAPRCSDCVVAFLCPVPGGQRPGPGSRIATGDPVGR